MTRSRTFYAFLIPTVIAGGVLLRGVTSRADDDDDDSDSDSDVSIVDDAASGDMASLWIASNLPADVWLDGVKIGRTPLGRYEIRAGSHDITLPGPNGEKLVKTIQVDAGS